MDVLLNKNMFTCLIKALKNIDCSKAQFEMYTTLKSINAIGWIANPISNHV